MSILLGRALLGSLGVTLLGTSVFIAPVVAEEKPADEPSATQAAADRPAQKAMRTLVGEVELTVQAGPSGPERTLTLRPQPLVSYGDETRFIKDSTLWVWMDGARPAVFQKLEVNDWVATRPLWTWCVASASPGLISGHWPGVSNKLHTTSSVAWQAIPEAVVPENAAAWPIEARTLNRRFTILTGPEQTRGNTPEVLRAVARPILEFKAPDQGVPYGAVFSHAGGTNPNVLLIVQVETQPDGARRWTYAPMHMTATKITVQIDEKEAWVDPAGRTGLFTNWGYFFAPRDAAIK